MSTAGEEGGFTPFQSSMKAANTLESWDLDLEVYTGVSSWFVVGKRQRQESALA